MALLDAHRRHTEKLREAVIAPLAETAAPLRAAVMERAAGGAPASEPYDDLARQIGEAAHRLTDAQVAAVRDATGSDRATFEVIMSACVGAGLARWDTAARAIEAAGDATS